jgi:PAS domain S-box-containing protein
VGLRALPTESEGSVPAEERLALVEFLLRSDDPGACAQHALAWLGHNSSTRKALCLAVDRERNRLVAVASYKLPPADVEEFWVDLDERGNALVRVLNRLQPERFNPGGAPPSTPLGSTGFHAVPLLGGPKDTRGVGLLLAADGHARPPQQLLWTAEVLGERLSHWHGDTGGFGRGRAMLHSIINAVTDPILLTDVEGKLVIANARAEKLFSSHEDESEGRRRAVALNNMLFSAALASRTVDRPDGARNELLLVDPVDGSDLLFELLSSPLAEPDGETGIVSVLRNVTDLGRATAEIGEKYQELRVARAEARSERHRLDLIIDSVVDPIIVTDPSGDIVLMNAPAEKIFSVPPDAAEAAQRHVRANDAHFSSFVSNLLFSGNDLRLAGEISMVDPVTGEPLPVEAVSGKILSESGELTTVVTILHDRREAIERASLFEQLKLASVALEGKVQAATAELANQNELLRRQGMEIERASAAKSQFLANVSHELRTPLNAVLGYTSMLMQGVSGGLNSGQKRSLTRVDSNARHLLQLINEVLDITRIEAGRMPLHFSEFKLPDLISEVLAELDPIIGRSKLELRRQVPERLPSLRSDRQKVKQIVVNLLSNALKFTHQGQIGIEVSYRPSQKRFVISVEDTGIGIAAEDQERVFEDFRQLDNSPTRAYGGTGLGLSICRRLAAMLEGKITLKSELGKGSSFSLQLPRKMRRP